MPAGLDLDGAQRLPGGSLLLSFDGSGTVAGVSFADEDLLEYDPSTAQWSLAYDGSASLGGWERADLDAVGLPPRVLEIPTLGPAGLVLLAALLGVAGWLLAHWPAAAAALSGRRNRERSSQ